MTDQEGKEERLKGVLKEATPADPLLLKEEVINDLDKVIRGFQDGEIDSLRMYCGVVNAWRKANKNEELRGMIEEEMRRRRQQLHQVAQLDISEQGDPVRQRFDPNLWLGKIPEELSKREEKFVLDRIGGLRGFFVSLTPKNQTSSDEGGARREA
jgi:hypothetical protein